jgi:esterase/lipase
MGTMAAFLYSANDKNIRAIVADGGPVIYTEDYIEYVFLQNEVKNFILRKLLVKFTLYTTDMAKIKKSLKKSLMLLNDMPILFIQGEKDFINPLGNIKYIIEILNSNKVEYWEIKNSYHLTGLLVEKEVYTKKIIEFFDENLCI